MTPGGYERHVYSTTDEGRSLLEQSIRNGILSRALENLVREIADEYGEISLPDLIEEAYRRFPR